MTRREATVEAKRRTRLSAFARRLLAEWRRAGLPVEGTRVVLAVSGGADSTALLLACEELRRAGRLKVELLAAHLDHGLRGESAAEDARWVASLASGLGVECVVGGAPVRERARASGDNLEQAARRARYEFLAATARARTAAFVLTAHTLDDQAETVLLRLLRGSGADGLGAMRPARPLDAEGSVTLARPLLRWARRADTAAYARARGVEPRADEMNEDERYARVRLRRQLLPLAETFNPRAVEALGRAAELLREDSAALEDSAAQLLREAAAQTDPSPLNVNSCDPPALPVSLLASAPRALRRRALRRWVEQGRGDLRRVELAHVEAVERLLEGERGGRVAELPGGSRVERRRGWLLFRRGKQLKNG